MDPYERQQFDMLLQTAVDHFITRLDQRHASLEAALERLRADPNGDGVWLDQFTEALFRESLLDTPAGACFVLEALARREAPAVAAGRIESTLLTLARSAFAVLLRQKTEEALEQRIGYQAVDTGDRR